MIEKLAQHHEDWVRYAISVSGNRDDANDLVQDMYLKLYDCDKEINKSYVYCVIKNIFLDNYRKQKVKDKTVFYQETETEQEDFDYFEAYELAIKELPTYKQLIVKFSTNDGVNHFERESGISKATIIRIRNEFKKILWQKVKDLEML